MTDPRIDQYAAERTTLARAIHKRVNSSRIGATVPYSVGDAERAAAAVIMEGWTPPIPALMTHWAAEANGVRVECLLAAGVVPTMRPIANDNAVGLELVVDEVVVAAHYRLLNAE